MSYLADTIIRRYAQGWERDEGHFSNVFRVASPLISVEREEQIRKAVREKNYPLLRAISTYVYAISGADKVKVGAATNPPNRLGILQIGSPVKLELVDFIALPSREHALRVEEAIHADIAALHSHGEWFGPRGEVLEAFRTAKAIIIKVDPTGLSKGGI